MAFVPKALQQAQIGEQKHLLSEATTFAGAPGSESAGGQNRPRELSVFPLDLISLLKLVLVP